MSTDCLKWTIDRGRHLDKLIKCVLLMTEHVPLASRKNTEKKVQNGTLLLNNT